MEKLRRRPVKVKTETVTVVLIEAGESEYRTVTKAWVGQ